ncbi:MAG TPA: hypothetical protein VFV23_14700 [Verrucomicrobiae bacterium]|nr:hypothetical protein [Verrucomicrobiae bacterium]
MNKELSDFAARLRETIAVGQSISDTHFNKLALELFALQRRFNPIFGKICGAKNVSPQTIVHWTQIPFAPTAVFKELEITSLAPDERATVFHSSGTTEQKPSRHFHCAESLALYEASLWNWFERRDSGPRIQNSELLILTPPPELVPHSSLVHMFETIRGSLAGASVPARRNYFGKISADGSWILDFDVTLSALTDNSKLKVQNSKFIFGTAFSFVHLLDFLAEKDLRFQLPENSRIMETGGYKNRSRSMPKAELHLLIETFLGVPRENILCEYGMSELSSQAYAGGDGRFQFSPWARTQIVSPETGREVADGETGLIRIFDLANVFSVAAIQTEDLGIRRGDQFELVGRAPLAEPRGCSLMTA